MIKYFLIGSVIVGALFGGALVLLPANTTIYDSALISFGAKTDKDNVADVVEEEVKHIKTPQSLRGVYMTACAASTRSFRDHIISIANETEINSVIVDIKDFSGTIAFSTKDKKFYQEDSTGCFVRDMKEFVEELHGYDIYVIARLTVFQDPYYASRHPDIAVQKESDKSVWNDYKGLAFVDVGAEQFWNYITDLSKEAYAIGFDEINYDYIRFPSDGNMNDIYYPVSESVVIGNPEYGKALILRKFWKYIKDELEDVDVITSADLFGMTTTNTDDLNIGQIQEYATPYFDYIMPMTYPSHYPSGFFGIVNPNERVYDVIKISMDSAVERITATTTPVYIPGATLIASTSPQLYAKQSYDKNKLRPWLQDFDYGGNYDIAEVRAQIQAVYDAGLTSWILWDPSNRYTRDALLSKELTI